MQGNEHSTTQESSQQVVDKSTDTITTSSNSVDTHVDNSNNSENNKRKEPPTSSSDNNNSQKNHDKNKRRKGNNGKNNNNHRGKKEATEKTTANSEWGKPNPNKAKNENEEKYQKKRVALFIGYLGTNYNGSQTSNFTNPNVVTVEETFFKALCKAGGVAEHNSTDMNKVHFHRSSRTDKGVHAASNVLEMKLLLKPGLIEEVRKLLPDDIVFYGFKRVSKSFHAKEHCTARTYEYLLPAFALAKDPHAKEWFRMTNLEKITDSDIENHGLLDIYNYDATSEEVEMANRVLKNFIGTHSYHNYTQLTKAKPNSFNRHITRFECSNPFEIAGVKVVKLTVCGSSFIYNQIRKMVGFFIGVMRGVFDENEFDLTVDKEKTVPVPLAPANGLLLCEQEFKRYNSKAGSQLHGNVSASDYANEMEEFKKRIYSHMLQVEKEDHAIGKFLLYLRGWLFIKPKVNETSSSSTPQANVEMLGEETEQVLDVPEEDE
ncbi:hypothetical protein C9374_012447 [Naegleria lovaniensis]|uniref:Pseudouridine synthase I TruA alpha/beta domain-containing protein n=1 Tax=Naegleria lovaniensis TaxID=51637 RepID=A0AA88GWF4_NAELO|nr:uncharacterized protein C9374_012447 [Naegleria lovaniensis]KAG2392195.1 hypothetical protein C9374_012447 [Naegleria lovaniensis]